MALVLIEYILDASNCIISVNDEWTRFAEVNSNVHVLPSAVLGKPLEAFISDATMKELYRRILQRARTGQPITLKYRCDSESHRRTFAMSVSLLPRDQVKFSSLMIEEVPRPAVELLQLSHKRDSRIMRMCSWCQKVQMPDGTWEEIEKAISHYGFLADETLPTLSHGLCESCRGRTFAELS